MVPWAGLWSVIVLFLMVPWAGLWSVIVAFPGHSHLLSDSFGIQTLSADMIYVCCNRPYIVLFCYNIILNKPDAFSFRKSMP